MHGNVGEDTWAIRTQDTGVLAVNKKKGVQAEPGTLVSRQEHGGIVPSKVNLILPFSCVEFNQYGELISFHSLHPSRLLKKCSTLSEKWEEKKKKSPLISSPPNSFNFILCNYPVPFLFTYSHVQMLMNV